MILERSRDPSFLSNAWLVGDRDGGAAVLIDAGAPKEPLERAIRERGLTLSLVLLTHAHGDHTLHAAHFAGTHGAEVCGHAAERFRRVDRTLEDGEVLGAGDLRIEVLHVPGHTTGQLAFAIDGVGVFTGDTLFRGTVGGTRGPGHATFSELRRSIEDRLLALPDELPVHPGHMESTTIGTERADNPFVRLWSGRLDPAESRCVALGDPATLVLRAPDYDGGTKCQVRWPDGTEDVVAGSRVHDA